MTTHDSLINDYYSLNPKQFFVLRSLSMKQELSRGGVCEQSLSVVLATATKDDGPSLHLSFRGVRNLKFQQPEWSEISIGHIEIRSAADTPNASGRYLVRDADQDSIIKFECNDFDSYVG
jgi:hypothetical protein